MKFKTHTLILIALTVALFLVYMNIERFTTTITIPDDLIKSQIADTVADKKGKKNKKNKTPISVKGPEFAKLTPSSNMEDRLKAFMTDARAASSAAGEIGATKCTDSQKGGYTSECKVTGFCNLGGYCDGSPEDALDYGIIDQRRYTELLAKLRK